MAPVDAWRAQVTAADAVLLAAPEYAGALAGAIKNALDWLVGTAELYRKPVAVLSAGTTGGHHALRMLAQTVTWQGGYVVAELGIASPRTKVGAGGDVTDAATRAAIADVTRTLLAAASGPPNELVARATRASSDRSASTSPTSRPPPERRCRRRSPDEVSIRPGPFVDEVPAAVPAQLRQGG